MARASGPLVLLDACCVINLLASEIADEILSVVPARFAVARLVLEREVLYVPTDPEEDAGAHHAESEPKGSHSKAVDLRPLVDMGIVEVLEPDSEQEYETFVALALELDDGEAMTGALAARRGADVATDDRKAIRVLASLSPSVPVRRTSELMKAWATTGQVPRHQVKNALLRIEKLASFLPPRDDPERRWWLDLVRGA